MIMDELAEQTRNWMNDLDNFGLPPPPKTLYATNIDNDVDNSSCNVSTTINNKQTKHEFTNNDANDPVFLDKVRKFQQTPAHPYASPVHVETTKVGTHSLSIIHKMSIVVLRKNISTNRFVFVENCIRRRCYSSGSHRTISNKKRYEKGTNR